MTTEQVKSNFRVQGVTVRAWAQENGFPYIAVIRVLNGQNKAIRGQGHRIAVALGLKPEPAAQDTQKAA